MPYCNIKTNVKGEKKKELSKALTKTIELIPGKTENWIMTSIDDEAFMTFAGSEEPTAMITLKTFGQPAQKYYDMVTAGFCETVNRMLGIPKDESISVMSRVNSGAGTAGIFKRLRRY